MVLIVIARRPDFIGVYTERECACNDPHMRGERREGASPPLWNPYLLYYQVMQAWERPVPRLPALLREEDRRHTGGVYIKSL